MTKLEQSFEVSQTALVAVKDYLLLHQKLAQDVSTLATEYGYDRCSNKYMLAELQSIMTKFANMEWELTGAKSEQSQSVKGLLVKILAKVGQSNEAMKKYHEEMVQGHQNLSDELAQSLTGIRGPPAGGEPLTMDVPATGTPMTPTVPMASMPAPSMPAPSMPATMPPTAPTYGQPGYPPAPVAPISSVGGFPPTMPVGPVVEQPQRALRINVRDESGREKAVAVSPTRNPPGARLPSSYTEEFGLGFIQYQRAFHRRLPAHFLPPPAAP